MNKFDWFPVSVFVVGAVVLLALFIWGRGVAGKENERRNQDYAECKAQVSDIEWCFKQFRPVLE